MEIRSFFDARTSTLTYVVHDEATRDAVVIDPVLDYDPIASQTSTSSAQALLAWIRERGLKVHFILETHAHADHLTAAQFLAHELGAKVVIGEDIRVVQKTFVPVFGLGPDFRTDGSQFDKLVADGEVVRAGSLEFRAMHTPGHTPACMSYVVGDAVFTGDALFMPDSGTGRCDFPRGSAEQLYASIQRLYALPDATRVFVGHDYQPRSTAGVRDDHRRVQARQQPADRRDHAGGVRAAPQRARRDTRGAAAAVPLGAGQHPGRSPPAAQRRRDPQPVAAAEPVRPDRRPR
jgi:glyoxylase-like metal-dependent hydrolase (beta-lactamase superfamily II)